MVRNFVLLLLLASTTVAHADPSERSDRDRIWHVAPFAVGGAFYLALEFGLKEKVSRGDCRWCKRNGLDTRLRTLWKWDKVENADLASNLTGYVGAPVYALGLLAATTAGEHDVRRWFDDTVPVLQAAIITGIVNQTVKILFARRRPFAEFKGVSVQKRAGDINTSFFSGHSALAFAMATSSGTVASLRDYKSAPALWIGGLVLAGATAYLRVGSDAHYFSDVLVGSVIGAGIGIAIPLVFHQDALTDEPAMAAPRTQAPRREVIVSFGSRF